MLVLALLIACADPVPVALAACEAVPGVATDPAGLALLEDKLTARDYAALVAAAPTIGLETVGPEGMATLRSQTKCVLEERNDAGGSQWAIKMTRTQPEVRSDGTFGDPVDKVIEWHVMAEDAGPRVEVGVAKAASMRARIAEAEEQQDLKRIAGLWKAIAETLPDPVLIYDIEAAQLRSDSDWVRQRMKVAFDHVEAGTPDAVIAAVSNPTETDVQGADIGFAFLVEGAPTVLTAHIGPLPAGGETTARMDVPEGATGAVRVAAIGVTITP